MKDVLVRRFVAPFFAARLVRNGFRYTGRVSEIDRIALSFELHRLAHVEI